MDWVISSPQISSFQGDRKPRRMLNDFLLEDIAETEDRLRNSAGFKSSSSKISNAIHKASMAVISSAVKLLPCKSISAKGSSPNGSSKNGKKKTLFSKNLFRSCLGKNASSQVHSGGAASADKYQPSSNIATTASTTISTNSDASESESEFTHPLQNVAENGLIEAKPDSSAKSKTSESIEAATTKIIWSNEGEEEQSSPVFVLNLSDDEYVEQVGSTSPYTRRLSHLKGTNEEFFDSRMGKINHEAGVLPLVEDSEDGSPKLSFQSSPSLLDWICGRRSHSEASLGWKEEKERTVYVDKDVEEAREWKGNRDAEREEVPIRVEADDIYIEFFGRRNGGGV